MSIMSVECDSCGVREASFTAMMNSRVEEHIIQSE